MARKGKHMRQPSSRTADESQAPTEELGEAKTRILRAAEHLFAEHGYSGASLRSIMAEAGVNTAAIHYHFGGKEDLLRTIFEMRVAPMNTDRQERFDLIERQSAGGAPDVSDVLRAFIEPAIRRSREPDGQAFNRISALCSVDPSPSVRQVVFDSYDGVSRRFTGLLRKACAHLTDDEFYWRQHCIYGSMMYVRTDNGRVAYLLGTRTGGSSAIALEQLLIFLTAGMKAPGSEAEFRS
jgi:AcrR family transcriptional regulator